MDNVNEDLSYMVQEKSISEKIAEQIKSGNKFSQLLNGLEIVPNTLNVLVKPYKNNPYEKIEKNSSGIILDDNFVIKNEQSGEEEELQPQIMVGRVLETGPDCKFVQEGDDVYYCTNSVIPIPFFRQGLYCIPETRIIAIVNTDLKNRFKHE